MDRVTAAKIIATKPEREFMHQLRDYGWLKDGSLDLSYRGGGHAASRRQGKRWLPFRCSCDWSPCSHEQYYENNAGTYVEARN